MIEKAKPKAVEEKPPAITDRKALLEWHVSNVDGLLKKREEEKTKP